MNYRRAFVPNGYLHIIITSYDRKPIFIENIDILRTAFKNTKTIYDFEIIAICVLPNHIHLILHPNNIGRCGHICNASYAVSSHSRGLHIGEKLVLDCIEQGRLKGFGVLQFNAVVATNTHARHLYERLGFTQFGTIPKGFRMKDGDFEDICPYYREL